MNTVQFGIVIHSAEMTLAEISEVLGKKGASGSHTVGDVRFKSKTWSDTVWRSRTLTCSIEDFQDALEDFCERKTFRKASKKMKKLPGCSFSIDLVVYQRSFALSFAVHKDLLRTLGKAGFSLDVSCYPTDE